MWPDRKPLGVSTVSVGGPASKTFAHIPVPGKIILGDSRVHQKYSMRTFMFEKKTHQRSPTSLYFKLRPGKGKIGHRVSPVLRFEQEHGWNGAACPSGEAAGLQKGLPAGFWNLLLSARTSWVPFLWLFSVNRREMGTRLFLLSLAGNSVQSAVLH